MKLAYTLHQTGIGELEAGAGKLFVNCMSSAPCTKAKGRGEKAKGGQGSCWSAVKTAWVHAIACTLLTRCERSRAGEGGCDIKHERGNSKGKKGGDVKAYIAV